MTTSIGILGLGAVGTLMAAHWQGLPLFALTRDGQATAARLQDGDQLLTLPLPAWQGEPLDWLVITTKAAATLPALMPWQTWLPQVKRLLLLQNGMGQHQQVAHWLQTVANTSIPELWAGISTEGGWRRDDGVIVRAGRGEILIGSLAASAPATALPDTTLVDNIEQRQRDKLAINAVINPLTAVWHCRNGELVSVPEYQQQLLALCEEVSQLYQQLGWPLSFDLRQRAVAVATATGANKSSTLQDILAGRPHELDYICGYLLQAADNAGLELPLTRALMQGLQGQQP